MPSRPPAPDADRARAVKLARHAAAKHETTEQALHAAIRFAAEHGASLRELANATGLSHMTVKRILERTPEPADP